MQWWCSASGVAWTWEWRAYPGVWLFVLALAGLAWRLHRGAAPDDAQPFGRTATVLGLLTVWIALDWPVGALGAGYLLWAHTGQFLLLAMIAPALLLYGLPRSVTRRVEQRPARGVTRMLEPLTAIITFNLVVIITHVPVIVDTLMATQAGAFFLDLLWIAGGLAFWWPIVMTPPGRHALAAPLRIVYLLVGTFLHMGVGIVMVAVPTPLYRIYELAPPVGLLRMDDQQRAGGLMLGGGSLIVLVGVMLLVYVWMRGEIARERRA